MNKLFNIFNFVEEILDLFTAKWAWCPIKVDNRTDRF